MKDIQIKEFKNQHLNLIQLIKFKGKKIKMILIMMIQIKQKDIIQRNTIQQLEDQEVVLLILMKET